MDIRYDGKTYPTAVHVFYAAKAKDAHMQRICVSRSAGYASKMGRRAVATPNRLLTAYNKKHENIWGICTCDKCGCNLVVDSFGTRAPVKKKSGAKPVLGVVSLLAVVVCVMAVIINVFINSIDKNDAETAGRAKCGVSDDGIEFVAGSTAWMDRIGTV